MHFSSCSSWCKIAFYRLLFVLAGIVLSSSVSVFAGESKLRISSLGAASYSHHIASDTQFLLDSAGTLTLADVRTRSDWNELNEEQFNVGWTDDSIWIRALIANESYSDRSYVLEIKNRLLDEAKIYFLDPDAPSSTQTKSSGEWGDHIKQGLPNAISRAPAFPFVLKPKQKMLVYLQVRTSSWTAMPLVLWDRAVYFQKEQLVIASYGLVFGVLLTALVYNSVVGFSMRDKTYLPFVFYTCAVIVWQLCWSGFGHFYFWHEQAWLADLLPNLSSSFCFIFGAWFIIEFLELKQRFRYFFYFAIALGQVLYALIALAAFVLPERSYGPVLHVMAVFNALSAMAIGIWVWRKGSSVAREFTLSWGLVFFGTAGGTAAILGVFYLPFWSEFGQTISFALQAGLFCVSFSNRINELRNDKLLIFKAKMEAEQEVVKARAANQAKSDFLANMSHEIRTPLNGIIGMLSIAQKKALSPEVRRDLSVALRNSETLLELLNDILDISKIEHGKFDVEKEAFDLRRVVHDQLGLMQARAEEKELLYHCDMDDDVPVFLIGDAKRLRQILFNLVGNAIKFTETGGVTLRIRLTSVEESTRRVALEFKIIDTGIGISAQAQQTIFGEFEQGEAFISQRFGGTGLGLSISKSLVEMMGGTVRCDSKLGMGTTFTVLIPFGLAESDEIVEPDFDEEYLALAHRFSLRVLCAEDGQTNQEIIRTYVESMGHMIEVVESGEEAIRKLSEQLFDVVLMDGRMPGMSGEEAIYRIRHGGTDHYKVLDSDIWIVALTANAMKEDRQRFADAGTNEFIAKPLREHELHEVLEHAMLYQLGREITLPFNAFHSRQVREQLDHLLVESKPASQEEIKTQVPKKVDAERLAKFRRVFAAEAPEQLKKLKLAISASRYEEIAITAHNIKGAASYIGETNIMNVCAELEKYADARQSLTLLQMQIDQLESWIADFMPQSISQGR